MKIIEVGNKYYRRGHENALNHYTVSVGGCEYEVVASSEQSAKGQAEARYEDEYNCLPGRGARADWVRAG